MDSKQALSRLCSLLKVMADEAGAECAALYAPASGGLSLVKQVGLDQAASDLVFAAWAKHEARLSAGQPVRYGVAVFRPLFDKRERKLVAVLFLDHMADDFPEDLWLDVCGRIVRLMQFVEPTNPIATYLACGLNYIDAVAELERDRLAVALRQTDGNVSAAARRLGICRDTVYVRAAQLGMDVRAFRLRRPRRA